MNQERHEFWGPEAEPEEHVFGSDELRTRFIILGGLNLVCLIALISGVFVLSQRGFEPPGFVGYSHGLFFVGDNKPITAVDLETEMQQQLIDTIEVLFLRTEKGALPDLASFVDQSVLEQIERDFKRSGAEALKPGFAETFTVLEARTTSSPERSIHRRNMMGVLSSRGLDGSQTSTIYLQCDFAPKGGTSENAVGWKLVALQRLREDEYFSKERDIDREKRLHLTPDATPTTPHTPSQK